MDKSWINHRPSIVYCLLPLKLSNDLHHHRKTIPLETEFPSSTTVKLVIILKSDLIRGRTFELFDRAVLSTIKQKRKKRKISCSSLIWRATVPRISSRRAIVTLYRFTRGQHWHSTPGIVGYFSYCLSSFNIKFLRATRRLSRALIAGTGRNFRFRNCENVQWTQSGYFSSSIIRETKERSRSRSLFLETITALLFFHGREIFRFLSQLPQSTQAAAKYHPPWKNSILLSLHRDKGSPRYGAHEYLEKLRKNSAPLRGRNRTWRDVTFTIQCNLNAIRGEGNSPLPPEFEFLSR